LNGFDNERLVQQLLEENLGQVFPGLEFVKKEYQIEVLRPDTIAFDQEKKSFVIIEYKNLTNKSVIDQGISYYQQLQEHREAFILLYNKERGKLYDIDNIEWDETRVIFIAPSFTTYQTKSSRFAGLPIELYEIREYEGRILTLNRIESEVRSATPTRKKVAL
jgi:hypothetical protein